ncbi:NADH-quinone oxidoreductase subunit K [Trichinella spiralis]|uniref:NADH-quinone oxidoreductase subunit K n=1 Tax=Trichinella spiralis TaxID=6334 RepID=A0ABR3KWR3_TRISP
MSSTPDVLDLPKAACDDVVVSSSSSRERHQLNDLGCFNYALMFVCLLLMLNNVGCCPVDMSTSLRVVSGYVYNPRRGHRLTKCTPTNGSSFFYSLPVYKLNPTAVVAVLFYFH